MTDKAPKKEEDQSEDNSNVEPLDDQSPAQASDAPTQAGEPEPSPEQMAPKTNTLAEATPAAPAAPIAAPAVPVASAPAQAQANPGLNIPPPAPASDTQQSTAPQTSAVLAPISADELKQDHHATANDLAAGHITPETYSDLFAKKSTLGKIGTLFGLMLSGAGSGLTGQPNMLLEMMNKQIGNDLDAQKTSAGNAQNLLRLNQQNEYNKANIGVLQKQGSLTDAQAKLAKTDADTKAYTLSRMQANQMALHTLVSKMNALPVGSALRQQAEQQLAILNQSIQNENYGLADKAAGASALSHAVFNQQNPTAQAGENQPTPMADPNAENTFQQNQSILRMSGKTDLADYKEQRHMPGIPGQSSVPLNGEDRNQIQSAQALIGSLQRLKQFAVNNPAPLPKSSADIEGKALAAQVQGDFRLATHGGVFKEGEQNFINQVVPGDPTTWSPFSHVVNKLDTVINETAARNNHYLSAKGFPVVQQPQEKNQPQVASDNIKTMNGVQYKKVKGGWAPVNPTVNQAMSQNAPTNYGGD